MNFFIFLRWRWELAEGMSEIQKIDLQVSSEGIPLKPDVIFNVRKKIKYWIKPPT